MHGGSLRSGGGGQRWRRPGRNYSACPAYSSRQLGPGTRVRPREHRPRAWYLRPGSNRLASPRMPRIVPRVKPRGARRSSASYSAFAAFRRTGGSAIKTRFGGGCFATGGLRILDSATRDYNVQCTCPSLRQAAMLASCYVCDPGIKSCMSRCRIVESGFAKGLAVLVLPEEREFPPKSSSTHVGVGASKQKTARCTFDSGNAKMISRQTVLGAFHNPAEAPEAGRPSS